MADITDQPDLSGEASWNLLEVPELLISRGTFISGEPEGNRLRVRHYAMEDDQRVVAKVWFGPHTEGPPGHVHGGAMASILDEVMGLTCWYNGHMVVAANLSVDYRSMLPLKSVVQVESQIARIDEKKVYAESTLRNAAGHIYAEAKGLFVKLPTEMFSAFLDTLPEHLRKRVGG